MPHAILSLTDPNGLQNSSLAYRSTPVDAVPFGIEPQQRRVPDEFGDVAVEHYGASSR